jgi:uncharacterized protein involved in exopolysaccharide biosynthesis
MPSGRAILGSAALLVALIVVVAGASYAISTTQAKLYTSIAVVRMEEEHPELQLVGFQLGNAPDERSIQTDALIAAGPDVVDRAARLMRIPPTDVPSHFAIAPQGGANAVIIESAGKTPAQALRYANDYISALQAARRQFFSSHALTVIHQLHVQIALLEGNHPDQAHALTVGMHNQLATQRALQDMGYGTPQVIKAPELPSAPATPHTQRNAIFGALFGLLLGIAIITLFFRSRRRNGVDGGEPVTVAVAPAQPPPVHAGPAPDDDWERRA